MKKNTTFKEMVRSNWSVLLCAALFAACLGFGFHTVRTARNKVAAEQSACQKAQGRTEILQAALQDASDSNQKVTGLSAKRKEADDSLAKELIELVTTWPDMETYKANRQVIKERFGISEDSQLLKTAMPDIGEENLDPLQINLSFEDMKTTVTDISLDGYSYLAQVTVTSKDQNGACASKDMLFTYKVGNDGTISEAAGWTMM